MEELDKEDFKSTIPLHSKLWEKIGIILIICLIPLNLIIGTTLLNDRKYYFVSLLVIIEVMMVFIYKYEKRKIQSREIVIMSVLTAITVASRAAFFMVPSFKPVIALVIIAGIGFGKEMGLVVGAMSMLVSNVMFGQGPWTPWQMFAMGIVGYLAGVLFQKRNNTIVVCIYGFLASICIYGPVMNTATAVIMKNDVEISMVKASLLVGLPFDVVQGIGTVCFLAVISKSMLKKMDRIKTKYGIYG